MFHSGCTKSILTFPFPTYYRSLVSLPSIFPTLSLPEGEGVVIPPGQEIKLGTPAGGDRRKLATVTGNKSMLVVRVTDVNGLVRSESAAVISDDFFGTYGDPVNMKSQFYDCSWGQLNIQPGAISLTA